LRRRGKNDPRTDDEPIDDSTLVFPGTIGTAEEIDGLAVEISRSGGEIIMRTEKAELGRWSSVDVTIRPIDSVSFEFIAETDNLIFVPGDPAAFSASPLVTVDVVERGHRKRRKAKKESAAVASISSLDEEPEQKKRRRRRAATPDDSSIEGSSKQSPEELSAARDDAQAQAVVPEPSTPLPDSEDHDVAPTETDAEAPTQGDDAETEPVTARLDEPVPQGKPSRGRRTRPWIRVLDMARHNRLFGLDRVPIDESLRGLQHEHSWEHRVATRSGLASHVCTICGKLRF